MRQKETKKKKKTINLAQNLNFMIFVCWGWTQGLGLAKYAL